MEKIGGEIGIRGVAETDWERWLPLWDGYNAFYERVGPTALPEAVTRATWARFFDPGEPVHALVAEADGALVGLVHYLFHRTTTSIAPTCYLNDLFTSVEARGRGVGRALIAAVYDRARQVGSTRVYWLTHETNTVARRLYDQVSTNSGFIVYRTDV
ncbi:MAG TPA: GNAT family N-acetyltransferase [Caulobacteraceae bacterium]|nr:GNAT family N-acetyltransferase [Caulobacteraceae bacterium]